MKLVELNPTMYRPESCSTAAEYLVEQAGFDTVDIYEEERAEGAARIVLLLAEDAGDTVYVRLYAVMGGPYGHYDGRSYLGLNGYRVDCPKEDVKPIPNKEASKIVSAVEEGG